MAPAEGGVFFEQAFVDVEAERLGLVVGIPGFDIGYRKLVDLAVFVEHVEQSLASIFGLFREQFFWPHFFDLETFGKFHELPEIGSGLYRIRDDLWPDAAAAQGSLKAHYPFDRRNGLPKITMSDRR
jgi:hypothetical protein